VPLMNYENQRRRAGVKAFLIGYFVFIVVVLVVNTVQSHQNGGGWVF
jgi:predicted nucleic acid-binding Zn ribbon protein